MLNRGQSTVRPVPDGVELISADVRQPGAITAAIGDRHFDSVCDFLSFTPDQVTQTLSQVWPVMTSAGVLLSFDWNA